MKTVLITREDVQRILTPAVAVKAVQKAFKAYGKDLVDMPPKNYLYFKNGDLRTMPAYIHGGGMDMAGVKCVNVHPENYRNGLPTVMAVITLVDPKTGFPLAVMDGTYLTGMRTGAAGALAVKLLANKNTRTVGFVGCGNVARSHLACLMAIRKLKKIKVWQRAPESTCEGEFIDWVNRNFSLETEVSLNIDNVTTSVDVLVTCTPSRTPLVTKVSPGTHINALGADAEGKEEIDPAILRNAKIVIDDWAQASHSGEINVPLKKRQIQRKHVLGTLGELAAGLKKIRTSSQDITLFDSTGLAIQDVSCAVTVYDTLKDDPNRTEISFF